MYLSMMTAELVTKVHTAELVTKVHMTLRPIGSFKRHAERDLAEYDNRNGSSQYRGSESRSELRKFALKLICPVSLRLVCPTV